MQRMRYGAAASSVAGSIGGTISSPPSEPLELRARKAAGVELPVSDAVCRSRTRTLSAPTAVGSPDVAILLDHFGSGGVERVACHVANGLQQRGLRVEMVVLRDTGPIRTLLDPAVRVRELRAAPLLNRGARLLTAVPALAHYLREHTPGLLHSPGNHTHVAAWLAVVLAGYRGAFVPKITNPLRKHGGTGLGQWLRRAFYGRAFGRAQRVLVLSSTGMDGIAEFDAGLPPRTHFVRNPYVSAEMLRLSAARVPADLPVILCVGRLSRQKNQALLLRAAARLRHRDWRLRFCGTGPDESALRDLANELGLAERVEFAGFVADLAPEYLRATVTALPSRWEDLPATILEAIACGCPVVATASSPALIELLREVGAREPVAVGDEAGLASAIEDALDHRLPAIPSSASLPYAIDAACEEHAKIFAGLLSEAR